MDKGLVTKGAYSYPYIKSPSRRNVVLITTILVVESFRSKFEFSKNQDMADSRVSFTTFNEATDTRSHYRCAVHKVCVAFKFVENISC